METAIQGWGFRILGMMFGVSDLRLALGLGFKV